MFFLDTFLGGAFLTYGTEVVKFSNMNQEQRTDPMVSLPNQILNKISVEITNQPT